MSLLKLLKTSLVYFYKVLGRHVSIIYIYFTYFKIYFLKVLSHSLVSKQCKNTKNKGYYLIKVGNDRLDYPDDNTIFCCLDHSSNITLFKEKKSPLMRQFNTSQWGGHDPYSQNLLRRKSSSQWHYSEKWLLRISP